MSASFATPVEATEALAELGVEISPIGPDAAQAAGGARAACRRRGGPHTRVVADFLIGAHAQLQADRILTRDIRFHRSYYEDLTVLNPAWS